MRPIAKALLHVSLSASAALSAEALASAPRYKMVLSADNAEHGVSCVSFVENPAIQRGWVALSAATAPEARATALRLSTEAQKQIVTGPALVPGLEILRLKEDGTPYFISFDAPTIEAAARRFAEKGQHNSTNEAHSIALSGNVVYESWIVADPANDKAASLGYTAEQVPAGTWMLTAHVPDAATWAKVQSGELTGFSIEALFDAEELKLAAVAPAKPIMKKPFWARLTAAGRALLGLSEVTLKDGTIVDVAEDGTVSSLDADGNITGPAGDGEYELPDGTMLVVKDGKKVDADGKGGASGSSGTTKVEAADEEQPDSLAQAKKILTVHPIAEADTAAGLADVLKKALAALGTEAPKPEDVKMAAVPLFLESVEMADGTAFSYNPITRRLLDSAGQVVQTGEYACADGSYFRVNTEQYTYQISKADYEGNSATATQLAAVQQKLQAAEVALAATPAGMPVALGGDSGTVVPTKPQTTAERYALAAVAGAK